jgi:FAD/FMN-containing dehydrogenase
MSETIPGLTVPLLRPGDAGFDAARQAWNLLIDQRPDAVVRPGAAADVVAAVRYAASRGLRVAAQSTGHNAGPLGDLTGTLLVRTDRMRDIQVDPRTRTARVGAGVVWADVVNAAARHGLAALAGSGPDVGVAGYTLGGGISFLGRKHGLAANSVTAVELVTAAGELVRADADHEADLFWALRGGGGSFGVVTALEFRLFPLTRAYAGWLWYPADRAGEVLSAWADLTRGELPDELTTLGRYLNLPPVPEIPEPVRGQSFVVVEAYHVGERAEADRLLAPLRALGPVNDTITTVPVPALSHLHMDPEQPSAGVGDGLTLDDLPPSAVDAFVRAVGADAPLPLLSAEIIHLGGELRRSRPGNGALDRLDAGYLVHCVGMTPVPDAVLPTMAQVQSVKEALAPWAARQMYLNFADTEMYEAPMWPAETFTRLREIKAKADPANMIRANHPVPPAE